MVCFFSSLSRARSLKEGKGKSGQYRCWWLSNAVAASSRKIVFKIRSESSRHALCTYHYVDKVYHSQLFILSLMVGFVLFFFSGLRCSGGAQADLCVYTLEGTDWPQATLWWSRRARLPAAGQPLARTESRSLWNFQWKSTRWLSVSISSPLMDRCWEFDCTWLCLYVCSSPAGMIEGTPQLHANAWKVSSACVTPVNLPIIDPCEMNQNNGNNGFNFFLLL